MLYTVHCIPCSLLLTLLTFSLIYIRLSIFVIDKGSQVATPRATQKAGLAYQIYSPKVTPYRHTHTYS